MILQKAMQCANFKDSSGEERGIRKKSSKKAGTKFIYLTPHAANRVETYAGSYSCIKSNSLAAAGGVMYT